MPNTMTKAKWNATIACTTLNLVGAMNRILSECGSDLTVPSSVTAQMMDKMQKLPVGDTLTESHVYSFNSRIIAEFISFTGSQILWPLFDNVQGKEKINWMQEELKVYGKKLSEEDKKEVCAAARYYVDKPQALAFIKALPEAKRSAAFQVFKSSGLQTLRTLMS